jgi:glutaredoxin
MRANWVSAIALGAAALVAASSGAQQLYRWVDKDGKVTYSQNPPPRDAGAKSVQQRRITSGGPADDTAQMPFAVRQAVTNFPVTLYTAPECAGCNEAKALLNKRGVPFREVTVSDEASRDGLKKSTGDTRVPAMLVGRAVEKGFEESSYNSALDNAGYPRTSLFTGKPPALPGPKPAAKPAAPAPEAPPPPNEGQPAQQGSPQPAEAPPGFTPR